MKSKPLFKIAKLQTMALLCLPVLGIGLSAQHAQASPQFIGDINLGLQSFNRDYGSHFAYGLGVRVRFDEGFEFGVEYRRAKLASDQGIDLTANSYLASGVYRMSAGAGSFGFGLEIGETEFDASADLGALLSATLASESKFAVGPKLNYEIALGGAWGAGVTADYLIAFTDPKISALGALANLSYKF